MHSEKITFTNRSGIEIAARLELPLTRAPHNFALFAHCFTCNKNLNAVRTISNQLSSLGFGVLRFDFTGLGQSDGEFENTNFSSNIEDLLDAAEYLETEYKSPSLLIGHSLGGAAVLKAAKSIQSVSAVVTIGAPSEPDHVRHLIEDAEDVILREGKAKVNIGGRPFYIKKQFLDDLENHPLLDEISELRKSTLFFHSPQDEIVEISNAAELYKAAWHPKSFVSLDEADHLLSDNKDAKYVAEVIGSWSSRYLEIPDHAPLETDKEVVVEIGQRKYKTEVQAGDHYWISDEPTDLGGKNLGPTPFELLNAALGTCTAMTLRMYADRKGWDLQGVRVHIEHDKKHKGAEENGEKVDVFVREVEIHGNLDEKQRERLIEIANKCPVHRTLTGDIDIQTEEKES